MKQYNTAIPIAQPIQRDKYKVREHALNFGVASFLIAFSASSSAMYITSHHYYQYALVASAGLALCVYSFCLMDFTREARCLMAQEYEIQQEVMTNTIIQTQEDNEYQKTFLPKPKGNGSNAINVYLSERQKQQIASTCINSGKLTINYLDSIGLSRARSEKLRNELSNIGYATFDRNSQLVITKEGLQSFKRLQK